VQLGGVNVWLDLVRVPPSGTWERRRADLFGLAENWVKKTKVKPQDALVHLLRRYLAAFGPASRSEVADWAVATFLVDRSKRFRAAPRARSPRRRLG
jgi:hypothetical protein